MGRARVTIKVRKRIVIHLECVLIVWPMRGWDIFGQKSAVRVVRMIKLMVEVHFCRGWTAIKPTAPRFQPSGATMIRAAGRCLAAFWRVCWHRMSLTDLQTRSRTSTTNGQKSTYSAAAALLVMCSRAHASRGRAREGVGPLRPSVYSALSYVHRVLRTWCLSSSTDCCIIGSIHSAPMIHGTGYGARPEAWFLARQRVVTPLLFKWRWGLWASWIEHHAAQMAACNGHAVATPSLQETCRLQPELWSPSERKLT